MSEGLGLLEHNLVGIGVGGTVDAYECVLIRQASLPAGAGREDVRQVLGHLDGDGDLLARICLESAPGGSLHAVDVEVDVLGAVGVEVVSVEALCGSGVHEFGIERAVGCGIHLQYAQAGLYAVDAGRDGQVVDIYLGLHTAAGLAGTVEAQEVLAVLIDSEVLLVVAHEDILGLVESERGYDALCHSVGIGALAEFHFQLAAILGLRLGVEGEDIVHALLEGDGRGDEPVVVAHVVGEEAYAVVEYLEVLPCLKQVDTGITVERVLGVEIVGVGGVEHQHLGHGGLSLSGRVEGKHGVDVLHAGCDSDVETEGGAGSHALGDGLE